MTNPNGGVIAELRVNSGSVTQAMDGALAHLDDDPAVLREGPQRDQLHESG